jgi:hypothetical protein
MRGFHAALARRAADVGGGRPVAGGSWPGGRVSPPSSHSAAQEAPADRSEVTRPKRNRALILGATLAAINLAGVTAVAQAQATNDPGGTGARRPPTERQVGEAWRHGQATSPEQTAADAALQRQLARERSSIPNRTPAQLPAPVPAEPVGLPGWLLACLGVLAAAVALAGGLAVLAAKRARRRARIRHAA